MSNNLSDQEPFPMPSMGADGPTMAGPGPEALNTPVPNHSGSNNSSSGNHNRNGRARLFSPRSTAALALSSIITQPRSEGSDAENRHPNDTAANTNEESEAVPPSQGESTEKDVRSHPTQHGSVEEQSMGGNQGDFHPSGYPVPPPYQHYTHGNFPPHHGLPPPGSGGHPMGHPYYPPHYQGPLPPPPPPPQSSTSSSSHPPYPHPSMHQGGYQGPNKKSMNGPMPPPPQYGMPPPSHYAQGPQSRGGWDPNHPAPPNGYYMPPPPHDRVPYHPYAPPPYGPPHMDPRMQHYPHPPPPPPPFPMTHTSKTFHNRSWTSPDDNNGKRLKTSREEGAYNRKLKSLGVLAEAFVDKHKDVPSNTSVVVDDMARILSVERRRIYDVINILESVKVVIKKSKNTYVWMGLDVMNMALGELQEEAITRYPDDALQHELINQEEYEMYKSNPPPEESPHHKTLNRLTQQYLHVYLVGHKTLSLPEASDYIHGSQSTMEDLAKLGGWDGVEDGTGLAMHKAASKGLKTKIRRLYDVSNVLYHMNWIVKLAPAVHQSKLHSDIAPLLLERRPQYKWNYMAPKEIRNLYMQAKEDSGNENPTMLQPVGPRLNESTITQGSIPLMGRRVTMESSRAAMTPQTPFGDAPVQDKPSEFAG